MRVLIATLAAPGFVYSALALAEALRERSHEVAFVTDGGYAPALAARAFPRLPNGASDGPSYQLDGWFDPRRVATQVQHLVAGLRRFPADVIVASNLAMGPLLVRTLAPVPLAVLGPLIYLWPSLRPSSAPEDTEIEERLAWRHQDQCAHLSRAADALGIALPTVPYERSLLLGDRYLLQGIPTLQRHADALPDAVAFVGPCTLADTDTGDARDAAWLQRQRGLGRAIVYVQLGRVFDRPSFWEALRARLAGGGLAAIVCAERYDGTLGPLPPNTIVRERLSQDTILPHVDAVVCSGHPTAVIGALAHGVPLVFAPAGSGTEDVAEACVRNGAAIAIDAADPDALAPALERLLGERALRQAARTLQREFRRHDGPVNAARAIEALVVPTRSEVLV